MRLLQQQAVKCLALYPELARSRHWLRSDHRAIQCDLSCCLVQEATLQTRLQETQ